MITIPADVRDQMKEPFGTLIPDADVCSGTLSEHLAGMKVVAVGDATALRLYACGFIPDIAVVDQRTKRNTRIDLDEGFLGSFHKRVEVTNPEGRLSPELTRVVAAAMKDMARGVRTIIMVLGEEDLAFIPCLLEAPDDTVVLYGQPDQGIVVSRPTKERRSFIRNALKKMEE